MKACRQASCHRCHKSTIDRHATAVGIVMVRASRKANDVTQWLHTTDINATSAWDNAHTHTHTQHSNNHFTHSLELLVQSSRPNMSTRILCLYISWTLVTVYETINDWLKDWVTETEQYVYRLDAWPDMHYVMVSIKAENWNCHYWHVHYSYTYTLYNTNQQKLHKPTTMN